MRWRAVQTKMTAVGGPLRPQPATLTIEGIWFIREPFAEAPIIQLIWGNSSMLCKRLSVAMVRNPWRPTPNSTPTPPPVSAPLSQPPTTATNTQPHHPLHKALSWAGTFECESEERRGRIRMRCWGRWGVGEWAEWISHVWFKTAIQQEQQVKVGVTEEKNGSTGDEGTIWVI